jgi:hypothetical protein
MGKTLFNDLYFPRNNNEKDVFILAYPAHMAYYLFHI